MSTLETKIPNLKNQDRIASALENLAGTVVSDAIKAYVKEYVDEQVKAKRLESLPVGYVWISFDSTNPGTIVGGTWSLIEQGRMLLAAGPAYGAGTTGGEAIHTLTKSEIPNYKIGDIPEAVPYEHDNWCNGGIIASDLGNASSSKRGVSNNNGVLTITSGPQYSYKISTDGGGQPHNNMPPYISVYMFRRTA